MNSKLRRIAHVIVFAVLTILLGITLQTGDLPMWFMIFPMAWSYADEAIKPLIQGRHFSWFDEGLNLLGTVIGGLVVVLELLYRTKNNAFPLITLLCIFFRANITTTSSMKKEKW